MIELRDIAPEPQVPDDQRGTGTLPLRYEDIVQDGRLKLEAITHALGAAVWRRVLQEHEVTERLLADRILPILSRVQVESGGGPLSVRESVEARGAFQLARTQDEHDHTRLRLDMWGEITAPIGATGTQAVAVGRVSAQHVLTRPFDPPETRQVHEIPGGLPEGVHMHDARWSSPKAVLELPRGATPIDEAFALDPCPIAFGLGHTDSNQHVNSLVYPRLFEEAALRRFHSLGLPTEVFARFVDIAFRKPCFAGDRMRIMLRAYRLDAEVGVIGAFITAGEAISAGPAPSDRAHCYVRMQFVP